MSLVLKIDKLRGRENYSGWSKKVRAYLITEGLWTSVSSINSVNEKKNKRVKFILLCLIDYGLFEFIEPDATPHAIWTTLQKQCTETEAK
ncbi:hypothetical protein DOY81_005604 [Sarcophaga bullata]|nr:hypothetical protein DOY81_005604 [Sarcophaga bullata]